MSNQELADRIDASLGIFCEAILDMKREQQELAARIAFVMPTDGDIRREVDEFITRALAA